MDFPAVVAGAFAPQGPLSTSVDAFSARDGQTLMAVEVARTMEAGGVLVVEAGTGIGKTFAYLVPALLGGERVLVSTATKALQDQLFSRDIPRLMAALGLTARVALLKGRSSYLCLHRLGEARFHAQSGVPAVSRQLAQIEVWAQSTQSGDLAELDHLDEQAASLPLVSSTRDNCLGARCAHAQACHVNQARREALAADLVVINHHLFFADLNIRESGVAELLPTVRAVIFDEAHQLSEIGVQFLGQQLSTGQLDTFGSDLLKVAHAQARGFAPWPELVADLMQATQTLRAAAGSKPGRQKWHKEAPSDVIPADWTQAMQHLLDALDSMHRALALVESISPELHSLQERAFRLRESLLLFGGDASPGHVRWLEAGQQLRMVHSPLDIAQAMQTRVLTSGTQASEGKSWIFTSATLGHDAALSWFVRSCGLEGARVLQVPSPFDYEKRASLYIPTDMPRPSDASHSAAVAHLAASGARCIGGRTLVLTTTLRAMRSIGQTLRDTFDANDNIRVLVQGEASKRELIDRFCQLSDSATTPCILVASASFWEGIDIPGDALQLLVIDKLPFAPPDDPLQQGKAEALESVGKSAFKELHLPQAAVALKQGAGRLIRRESDRGILVVCDTRLVQMSYGKKLLASLPPMQQIKTQSQWLDALAALTRPSTKD